MITSKQRSALRALANKIDAKMSVGKEGVTENVIKQASNLLDSKELIKISVQKNSELNAKQVIQILAQKLNAEPVQAIGNIVTLFRKSEKENIRHIEI